MNITEADVTYRNQFGVNRTCDAEDAFALGRFLYHQRTTHPWSVFKAISSEQWFTQFALPKAECDALMVAFGGQSERHFYADTEVYFPLFNDEDKALGFVQSAAFDALYHTSVPASPIAVAV